MDCLQYAVNAVVRVGAVAVVAVVGPALVFEEVIAEVTAEVTAVVTAVVIGGTAVIYVNQAIAVDSVAQVV